MLYRTTMKCGHVGIGKFIPITFVVEAENKKEAEVIARRIPRVKHDEINAVIHIMPCSVEEAQIIYEKNKKDPYLINNFNKTVFEEQIKPRIKKNPSHKSKGTRGGKRLSNLLRLFIEEEIQYAY